MKRKLICLVMVMCVVLSACGVAQKEDTEVTNTLQQETEVESEATSEITSEIETEITTEEIIIEGTDVQSEDVVIAEFQMIIEKMMQAVRDERYDLFLECFSNTCTQEEKEALLEYCRTVITSGFNDSDYIYIASENGNHCCQVINSVSIGTYPDTNTRYASYGLYTMSKKTV